MHIALFTISIGTMVILNLGSRYVAVLSTNCGLGSSYLLFMSSLIFLFMPHVSVSSGSLPARQEWIFHSRDRTEERVGSFFPLKASVKAFRVSRTSLTVSKMVMSVSLGMR